jgi:uncharacterized membrane-anchored protein YitT (DUF2179 family)
MEGVTEKVKEYGLSTVGVIVLAFAIKLFLEPNKIAGGGVMGIAIVLNHFIPVSVGLLMLMMNIILFMIAFIVIGSKFGAKTIYSSVSLSGMIWVLDQNIMKNAALTHDLFLAEIMANNIDEEVLDEKGQLNLNQVKPLAYNGIHKYMSFGQEIGTYGFSKKG